MGFINDLRNQTKRNPLDDYSMYNFNDVLNDIYIIDDLREKGDENGARQAWDSFVDYGVDFSSKDDSVGDFLAYLMAKDTLAKTSTVVPDEKAKPGTKPKPEPKIVLTDKEKLVSAIIIKDNYLEDSHLNLSYETVCKFLDLSHSRQTTLTNAEYSQLSRYDAVKNTKQYKSITRKLAEKYPIPDVTHVDDIYATPDLPDLYDEYAKDDYFKDRFKIKNIYEIAPNEQSANAHRQGKHSMILNSGTGNLSLVKIMNGGFKLPSELARENGVKLSGQMYGDAVYFARPDQISKNTAYVDKYNPGSKFIMVAEVFYDKKQNADKYGGRYHYDGHNLVHAHNVGRYSRDEYMVHPSQIKLKYILEVDKGHFYKPQPKAQNATQTTMIMLDGLDDLDDTKQI